MILIDNYPIDVAISEDHGFDNVVTEHPVEKGVNFVDHSRSKSNVLSYEGLVSASPIGRVAARRDPGVAPVDDAYFRLFAIRDANQPVVIEDSLGVYPSMLLETLAIMRGSKDPDSALHFRVSFREARIVSNEHTYVRVSTPGASQKRNLGTKPTTDGKPGQQKGKLDESWVLHGGKAFFGEDFGNF